MLKCVLNSQTFGIRNAQSAFVSRIAIEVEMALSKIIFGLYKRLDHRAVDSLEHCFSSQVSFCTTSDKMQPFPQVFPNQQCEKSLPLSLNIFEHDLFYFRFKC